MTAWLVHRSGWIAAGMLMFMVVALFAPVEVRQSVGLLIVGALVAAMVGSFRHGRRLCELCASEFPDNGADLAERRAWWLYLRHHWFDNAWIRLPWATLFVAAVIWAPEGWMLVVMPIFLTDWAAEMVAGIRHRQLLPWCPYCRDDGGDDEQADTPTPVGDGSRSA